VLLHQGFALNFLNVDLPLVIDNLYLLDTKISAFEALRTQSGASSRPKVFTLRVTVDGGTVASTGRIMNYMEGGQIPLHCILSQST
jgi:hypothetical protein